MALDFFDASINRVAAWIIGIRSFRKALLAAMLTPHAHLRELQDAGKMTRLFAEQEELKTMPFSAVWDEFCARGGVEPSEKWIDNVEKYEKEVLAKRV